MWELTGEIISLAGAEYPCLTADRQLDATSYDNPGLFTAMSEHLLASGGTGSIAFMQYGELASRPLGCNEAQGDFLVSQLHELISAEKCLWRGTQIESKKLGERHRDAIEHPLEGAHGRADAILLDERDEAVGYTRPPRKLPLRQAETGTHTAQARPDINAHERLRF